MINKREEQRIIKDIKNQNLMDLLKKELPYINLVPKSRVSTNLDCKFADDLIKYAKDHNVGSRSELIEKILINWAKSKGGIKCD